ncbi:MAG: hypothetical protein OEM02_11775 [Desulfobulbaceae bacterium]|nr:hypothetical protein [Desulfobulbaceae bacterium]
MPVLEIAEGVLHFIGRIFVRIFFEFIFEIISYFIGWTVLKIFTFGKYPSAKDDSHLDRFVSVIGIMFILAAVIGFILWKSR